jgi:hypothetical protein
MSPTGAPELQQRGIFRKEYKGRTARKFWACPQDPKNRFFKPAGAVNAAK